jgi:hypothetical protein
MSKRPRTKQDDEKQSSLFIQKAREIGAGKDESRADQLIGQLAKKAPEPHRPKKRKD